MSKLSEAFGPPVPAPANCRSAHQLFLDAVDKYPANLAIASIHQPAGLFGIPSVPLDDDFYRRAPYVRWSFNSLNSAVDRFTAGLEAAGVVPGMAIFTFDTNSAEHVVVSWAVTALGCILCPINPRNLANATEVTHMFKTASSVAPIQRPVVITTEPNMVSAIDQLGLFDSAIKIVAAPPPEAPQGWLPFEHLMARSHAPSVPANGSNGVAVEKRFVDALVLFTSGTTSTPKGCLKQHPQFSFLYAANRDVSDDPYALTPGCRACCVLPNNHAMGFFTLANTQTVGAAVVYPGPAFQTDSMLETMYHEKVTQYVLSCTYHPTTLVPTMVHALAGLKESLGYQLEHLASVVFGGSVLTPDVLDMCINALGARAVENVFGMTEGLVIRSGHQRDVSKLLDGQEVTVGPVFPGYGIKLTDPETNEVVPVNVPGELQGTAPSIGPYIGGISADSFSTDKEGRLWFKSGDQARMDEQGRIFITGRYKDMIIRGGENMSPTAIELAISKDSKLKDMKPQIVAAPDPIAGDIPVAVMLGNVDSNVKEAVQNAVLEHMGKMYIPEEVISLSDLGLSDYPRTMAGKIQKVKIATLVRGYLRKRENELSAVDASGVSAEVIEVWARAVGLEPSKLTLDTHVGEFADSITVMRVRDMIRRKTGKTLSLHDMANAGTIAAQIDLVKAQQAGPDEKTVHKRARREGPPGVEDMSHLIGQPDLFTPTKDLVTKAISPLGLDWNDVEDVIPAYDFASILIEAGLFQSLGFRLSMVAHKAGKPELRRALEAVLQNNRIMASYFIQDQQVLGSNAGLHVVLRQDKKLFDKIFKDGGKIKTVSELKALSQDFGDHVDYPGPLARATLYDVEETGTAGVLFEVDHAVVDASTGLIFGADLDKALSSTAPLPRHVEYKLWADSYHNQRTSAEARAATQWHVKRLAGLENHRKALWQPFQMPRHAKEYTLSDAAWANSVFYNFRAPAIGAFRRKHPQISAVALVKAALVLLNINRSGHTHALFANLEAARTTFPFLPKVVEATGQFEATDVSGPTIQTVINLIEFQPEETVLSLLERVQADQTALTRHAAAPLGEVMAGLGGEAGAMVPEVFGHQLFNWTPGLGTSGTNPYHHYETLDAVVKPRVGLSLNAALGGPDSDTIILVIKGNGFSREAYQQIAVDLERLTLWLLAPENWARAAGEYVAALQ